MNKQVSFDNELLVLVDNQGNPIGSRSKLQCHLGPGVLHKAFSVFVFNSDNEVLLQKRSAEKMLWPSYWSNSCCSHPRHNEMESEAVSRRVSEELGISIDKLEKHFEFEYRASFRDIGSEWERCSVFTASSDEEVSANENEIEAIKWVPMTKLTELLVTESERFTPWIKLEWEQLRQIL